MPVLLHCAESADLAHPRKRKFEWRRREQTKHITFGSDSSAGAALDNLEMETLLVLGRGNGMLSFEAPMLGVDLSKRGL